MLRFGLASVVKCVASHLETRIRFLNAHIPLYLYPFMNTTSKTRPFEYLRLTSLGVIGNCWMLSVKRPKSPNCLKRQGP
ncbi:cell differentiation protein rcd1 [Hordeum vulgare]|nr:cell differentiation protein rcd1 [Hordeum vulgare]